MIRRRAVVGAGMLVLAGGALALRGSDAAAPPPPCQGVARGLDEVWGGARRAEVAAAFAASDRPFAGRMLAATTEALDGYGRDWAAMRVEACRATRVTGEQSAELLDLRMQCLDRRLA